MSTTPQAAPGRPVGATTAAGVATAGGAAAATLRVVAAGGCSPAVAKAARKGAAAGTHVPAWLDDAGSDDDVAQQGSLAIAARRLRSRAIARPAPIACRAAGARARARALGSRLRECGAAQLRCAGCRGLPSCCDCCVGGGGGGCSSEWYKSTVDV